MRLLPFAALLPGAWEGGGQYTEPTSVACAKAAHTGLLPKCGGQHASPSRAGEGHIDLWGPGILSKAAPASSWAPVGRNERRRQGVRLLCNQLPQSQSLSVTAQRCRERLAEGEAAFFPPLLSLLQTSADLRGGRCFPSASAPTPARGGGV